MSVSLVKDTDIDYLECDPPEGITCDGFSHHWAIWDEDTNRHFPQEGHCPNRHHNSAVRSYDRFRDWGDTHEEALAKANYF